MELHHALTIPGSDTGQTIFVEKCPEVAVLGPGSDEMRPTPFLACVAASHAMLRWSPTVALANDEVVVAASPDRLVERFRERLSLGDEVIAAERDRIVRRFRGRARRFRYDTVEIVTFGPSSITFEHLSGPFARCFELFEFERSTVGTTRVSHSGTYALRGGLWTWPLSRTVVKSAFEDHVRQHMLALRDELSHQHAPNDHFDDD